MAKKKLKKPTKKEIAEMKAEFRAWELAYIHDLIKHEGKY